MADILLVPPEWVAKRMDVALVDVRRLVDYRQGHVPGALSIPFTSFVKIKGLSYDLPDKGDLERLLGDKGIGKDTLVIAYDDYGGKHASRFIYTLEVYGHPRLGLLDRGFTSYLKEGLAVSTEEDEPKPSVYEAGLRPDKVLTKERLLDKLRDGAKIVDVRAPESYELGHIPKAMNVPWHLLAGSSRIFRPLKEIGQILSGYGLSKDDEVVVYCDEGTSSALFMYAMRLVGYEKVYNYHMSYWEWCSDPELPREAGKFYMRR